jgi:acetyl-CoA carboxylase biotin carboxyl carrier protein
VTSIDTSLESMPATATDAGVAQVVAAVRSLLDVLPQQPERLCMRTEGVTVELQWPRPAPVVVAGPGPQAVPVGAAEVAAAPDVAAAPERLGGTATAGASARYVCAPSVGVFYRSPEPGAKPFVAEGDLVRPGQQVGIVEAMKLMLPVEADQGGRVGRILVENGTPVEYGERLIELVDIES